MLEDKLEEPRATEQFLGTLWNGGDFLTRLAGTAECLTKFCFVEGPDNEGPHLPLHGPFYPFFNLGPCS